MANKQTAVDWLEDKIATYDFSQGMAQMRKYILQAKQMEKEQIMLFFCNIGIKGVFSYYYSKSNEFKGNYPDTIEEFIDRCMKDSKFCRKWFSMCYDELKSV